jgi:hypothetical protein
MKGHGGIVKKIILAAVGALAVTAGMVLPVSGGVSSAAVIPHAVVFHAAPSAAKQKATCSKSGSASATVSVGSPNVRASGAWDKKKAKLVFALSAQSSFDLTLAFAGSVKCAATLPTEKFPIADTGLLLKLTPTMNFVATGKIDADFAWHPSAEVDFTVGSSGFTEGKHAFNDGAGVVFKGSGTVKITLNLQAVIETVGGAIGVEGNIDPTVTATVTGNTGTGAACLKGSAVADAKFDTFVDAFGFKKKFFSHEEKLGRATLSSAGCRSAPCFQASFPTCSSSNPLVTFTITGGDVGCMYSITVTWGDSTSTTKSVAGVASGDVAATFTHTYGKPKTYMLSFVSTVTGGDCFGNSGTMEFTLTK